MEIVPQLFINALIAGSIYALVSVGLALSYTLMRVMNFAHGHTMMVGAYFFYLFHVQLEWSFLAASGATILSSILLGLVSLEIFVLPFAKLSFLLTFLTSLCLSNIFESVISMTFGVNVKSLTPGSAAQSIEFAGVYITPIQIIIIVSALILLSIVAFIIHSSSLGAKFRALSEHPYAAESLGVSRKKAARLIFVLATLLAVYAGILVGYETNMQPTMGTAYTIKAFAAMILGGLGNIWGTVLGAYLLGLVENFAIGLDFGGYSIPAGYKDAFAFMIILLVLLVRPQGLFGTKSRRA